MVYFISDGVGHIKIGTTEKSTVEDRLKGMQTGNANTLEAIKTIKVSRNNDYDVEKTLHSYFKESHFRGEWFKEDDILEFLKMSDEDIIKTIKAQRKTLENIEMEIEIPREKREKTIGDYKKELKQKDNTIQRLKAEVSNKRMADKKQKEKIEQLIKENEELQLALFSRSKRIISIADEKKDAGMERWKRCKGLKRVGIGVTI